MRRTVLLLLPLTLAGALGGCSDLPTAAVSTARFALTGPAVYTYVGNPFTDFTCGTDPYGITIFCPTPNPLSSYGASSRLAITLSVTDPLPPNLPLQNISNLPGFRVTITDGLQSLTYAIGYDDIDYADVTVIGVATDATGQISEWNLLLGSTQTLSYMESWHFRIVGGSFSTHDVAFLHGVTPQDGAYNYGPVGTWTSSNNIGPADAIRNLISQLSDPSLGLTNGQINSLTDKLNQALASIAAGLYHQAINQLEAAINQINAALGANKISAQTATVLLTALNAIVAMLAALP